MNFVFGIQSNFRSFLERVQRPAEICMGVGAVVAAAEVIQRTPIVRNAGMYLALGGVVVKGIAHLAEKKDLISPQEQLRRLDVITPSVSELLGPPGIAEIITQYEGRNSAIYTDWYTALKRLGMLPEKIPALPSHIHKALDSQCPIQGAGFKVKDTHSLYLIPSGKLRELETRARSYGEQHLDEYRGKNPLQFHEFWCEQDLDFQIDKPQWVLISNEVVFPKDKNPCTGLFNGIIRALGINHTVSTLRQEVAFALLHKVANGPQQGDPSYTLVRDTKSIPAYEMFSSPESRSIVVGGDPSDGLIVACGDSHGDSWFNPSPIGVRAVWKF